MDYITKLELRKKLYLGHLDLVKSGLVLFSFGNISVRGPKDNTVIIKPSGVPYDELSPESMVEVSLDTGKAIDNHYQPSTDTPTHIEIYKAFKCNSVIHMHSEYATSFAQSRLDIKCTGTTHADYFLDDIPCTRPLSEDEIQNNYEKNTGLVIKETFIDRDPMLTPGVLVSNHGPFVWSQTIEGALQNAIMMEYLAKIQYKVECLRAGNANMDKFLIEKHFFRKHGKNSYYGQIEN